MKRLARTPRSPAIACVVLTCILHAATAEAYRPFDGTDAEVAEQGSFELELGPVHWYDRAGQQFLLTPVTVLNFGVFPETELVVDFQGNVALGPLEGRPRTAVLDTDVMVKRVLREGTLQGAAGPSIALELGILTPEIRGANAFGASANVIVSYRAAWGSLHLNERPAWSRAHKLELFTSAILEGPRRWPVRPVTEVFFERELGAERIVSALLGAIWSADENWAFDAGFRAARIGADNAAEFRLGFTSATQL